MPSDWIPITERLPEFVEVNHDDLDDPMWFSDVILLSDGVNVFQGARTKCGDDEPAFRACEGEIAEVTHWMPLPEPPKE